MPRRCPKDAPKMSCLPPWKAVTFLGGRWSHWDLHQPSRAILVNAATSGTAEVHDAEERPWEGGTPGRRRAADRSTENRIFVMKKWGTSGYQPPHLFLVVRALKVLGPERCITLVVEALTIESNGSLGLKNRSRRRTLGGVFLELCRQRSTPEEKRKIFRERMSRSACRPKPST